MKEIMRYEIGICYLCAHEGAYEGAHVLNIKYSHGTQKACYVHTCKLLAKACYITLHVYIKYYVDSYFHAQIKIQIVLIKYYKFCT